MRRNGAFILRVIAFGAIFALAAGGVLGLLNPRFDYGPGSMLNLYDQAPQTIDVLALGTSMTYAGVNTNVLWAEHGIAAYDLACAEQQYWHTYHYLQEALKTQSPKLILLDAKAATYPDDVTRRGRVILNTCGIRSVEQRYQAITASGQEDVRSFLLGYPQVHENWKRLTLETLAPRAWAGGRDSSWKGFIERDEHEQHARPNMVWTGICKKLNPREVEYFGKICDLAEEKGIDVLLVAYPNPDYANDHMYYNALWALADARGIPHVNFNDPAGHYRFRYTTDFADWQHLNVKGSLKLSHLLGDYLAEHYDLADRRGDAAYASWEACLDAWRAAWPEYADAIEGEDTL